MHRLCALVLILSSCVSVQAQNSSVEEGLYFDDCLGKIIEPSAVSPQTSSTEPKAEEPARDVAAEVIQPSDETQIADQSERRESKLTDGATKPNTEPPNQEPSKAAQVGALGTDQERDVSVKAVQPAIQKSEISTTGSINKNPSAAELARVIERILDEAMQPGDETHIANHTIQSESEQDEPTQARQSPAEVVIAEANAQELSNPQSGASDSHEAKDTSAAINGAEKTWSVDNLTDDAGELTAMVEQSRPAQIVTSEPTGLSNRAEGQVLNTFYQDLE